MKKIFCGLTLLIVIFGACGCMNHHENGNKIIDLLEEKYGKQFEIVKLSYEVSGEDGNFYRAVVKDEFGMKFTAYYYFNGSEFLLPIDTTSDGQEDKKPYMIDDYCGALLNKKTAEYFMDSDFNIAYAVVDISPISHVIVLDEISKGVLYCLSNDGFDVKLTVHVFVSDKFLDVENEITKKFQELNMYSCHLYIDYYCEDSLAALKNDYKNGISIKEQEIKNDARIVLSKYYYMSRNEKIELKQIIKGDE